MSRSIFVGDVHGCAHELAELLERVAPVEGDRLVFVGDLVARGPDTAGVIRLAKQFHSDCVMGNHEHRVVLAHRARQSGQRGPRLGPSHLALFDQLSEEDWAYLEALPLSLDYPDHNVRVVHAGVVPGVALDQQQAWTLLHVRSLTKKGAPSDRYASVSWAEAYDEDPHVVFGHNAQAGLQLHPCATGLDTGCVYGGRLSALVLEHGQSPPPPQERRDAIVSVPARDRYVDYGPRPRKERVAV